LKNIVVSSANTCDIVWLFREPLQLAVGHNDFMATREIREDV
jgi:hypothetical protein